MRFLQSAKCLFCQNSNLFSSTELRFISKMEQEKRNRESIEKFDIKLKSNPKDGVILQLHHTVRGSNGECRRIRFSSGAFDDLHEKLACADNVGNLFILDFSDLKFWKLSGIGPCTALSYVPNRLDTIVVATTKKFDINFLDIETGTISLTLTGHTAPAKHISFSNNKINNLLTASPVEAILWEQTNYTKYFTLNTYLGAQIQQITFTPGGDYLVACFQNDTIQIWRHESMKSVKQIIPNELKHMRNVAFTKNGRAMAMAGLAPTLILFSMDTWKGLMSIDLSKYEITGAQQVAFIPQVFDGGANKILAILSSDCALYFLDLETLAIIHTIRTESSGIRKFVVSPSGKYFLCILQLGEVNIYNTSYVMDLANNDTIGDQLKKELPCSSTHKNIHNSTPSKTEVEHKMRICMDSARLRRILMQYGEYPDKFRPMIWRSLLNTPRNKEAYSALLDKGIHPVYKDIEKQFTIHSTATLKNLKRLLSCLAHWCPLFGVMKFLPGFVFPFVKVLQKDPLLLFECVASVLLNYCQLWFEYAPFPPISILSMIENILGEHDPQLLEHFCTIGVTSQTYALKILETAFSEVLSCSEWLVLWDHILSNEPSFILMAVVAYNIVQRNAIKKLQSHEQMENFFQMQNPICKKALLKKIYVFLNETPEDIHPRKFFNSFISLEKGDCYQQFTGYPKATICLKLAEKERKRVKHDRHTLKELTRKSLEKIISEQSKAYTPESKSENSDDESVENVYISEKYIRKHLKQQLQSSHSKGDSSRRKTKEELLESIIHPTVGHLQKYKSNSDSKHSRKGKESGPKPSAKLKKKSHDKKTENLEREVEKLMKTCPTNMSEM